MEKIDNIQQLKKLGRIFNSDKIVTTEDLSEVLSGIAGVIKSFKAQNEKLNADTELVVEKLLSQVESENERVMKEVADTVEEAKSGVDKSISDAIDTVTNLLQEARNAMPKDGADGKDADEEYIISEVLNRIELPEQKEFEYDTGEEIVEKINQLSTDEKYQIDASHIKNLPQATGGRLGSTARNLWQLNDVTIDEPTNNQVLKYNSTTKQWENGTGGGGAVDSVNGQTGVVVLDADDIDDTSTTNKFVTAADITKLGNLSGTNTGDQDLSGLAPYTGATADVNLGTYDLITDTVKASTSAGFSVQSSAGTPTALFGAGGGANSTFYGGSKFDYATASTIAIFDGSKNLISASTSTYPSLTELSYVKGVTSSIQTQLNAKMTNPMTTGGDIIYGGASGTPTRLANGTAGQVLTSAGGTSAPTWETPGGGGGSPYTLVATDTTEYTTTSTSAVDMVTISGLSIPQDKTIIIYYQFKQNTSSYAALGLKLNSTIVGEAYISAGGATALGEVGPETEQRIRFGMVQLGPRETGFSGPGSGFGTLGGSFNYPPPVPLTPVSTNAQPEATITSITLRGISDSGSNTLSIKNIKILTL